MPHSSGGFSSGGGFHGGSNFSSGSGGGKQFKGPRHTYYPGALRYCYYHNLHCYYYYSDTPVVRFSKGLIAIIYVIFAFFLLLSGLMFKETYVVPEKMNTNYNTHIVIEDNLNVISNPTALENSFEYFLDQTGITPAFVSISYGNINHATVEKYAYNKYIQLFGDDENHFLMVYSEQTPSIYFFEGMQGDNTDRILTESRVGQLIKNIEIDTAAHGIEYAITNNIVKTEPLMLPYTDYGLLVGAIMIAVISIAFMALTPLGIISQNRQASAKVVDINAKEAKCEYCGGMFIETDDNCPHCGAKVLHDYFEEDKH